MIDKELYTLILLVRETKGRNDKLALLENIKGTPLELIFKEVARLTFSTNISFYTSEISDVGLDFDESNTIEFVDMLVFMSEQLAKRYITGHKARDELARNFRGLSFEGKELVKLIIKGDFDCGVAAKSLNKIWPNLIYIHPYQRGSSFSEKNLKKIDVPAFSQTKEDGLFVDIYINEEDVTYVTRQGNELLLNHHSFDQALIDASPNTVLKGEALVINDDGTLSRQSGNGYLNSLDVDPLKVKFVVWDVVTLNEQINEKSTTPYQDRFAQLTTIVNHIGDERLELVNSREVHSVDEIIEHFKEVLLLGLEGLMVKNKDMDWSSRTSPDMVKVKVEFECDLKIVGYTEGSGRNAGRLGNFICQTSDGLLEVNVGGGYSDEERINYWNNKDSYVGSIITVKSNGVIDSESKPNTKSLFLPRQGSGKIRFDKSEADSIERVYEQYEGYIQALKAMEV